MAISRRTFLETAALGGVAAHTGLAGEIDKQTGMPTRILGRTGARVSVVAFGGGSRFLAYAEEDKAIAALTRALDLGITYVDTASSYGNGVSEERIGKVLKGRRKQIWITTKTSKRNGDEARRLVEGSLKRLQTDQVDMLLIHAMIDADDLAAIEAKDGVLNTYYKLRDEKVTRFIGISCHTNPALMKTAIERHDIDCAQMALNVAHTGMTPKMVMTGSMPESFESLALPAALKKNLGVIAIKIFGQDGLIGKAPIEMLIRYTLTLPVATAILGMPKMEYIEENIRIAKAFRPLSKPEMIQIGGRMAAENKLALDRFFQHHVDA
jgi:aryl-alcohol dehydrogenase-like predicted oxidoreductase